MVPATLFVNPEHPAGDDAGRRLAEHLEQVRLARQAGFDGVAVGHHLAYGSALWLPPLPLLARLAAEADGMTLATCMLVLPLFEPVHLAQEAALLDHLSGGRLVLGVAPGWQRAEFEALGIDPARRVERFVEALALLEALWTRERVDFAGRHVRAAGLALALRPRQRPRPPFWLGGSRRPAIERAARLADPALGDRWVPSSHLTHETIARQAAAWRAALAALGKPAPAGLPVLRNVVVAPDRATAIREVGPSLEASYRVFAQWGLFTDVVGAGPAAPGLSELLAGRVVIGAPEQCAEELAGVLAATGGDRLVCRVQWMGMEQRLVLRTIELLAERVLPALAGAAA
jgi:alkanesulfonate monooxygenase SsuD/methylene tetrahydromethanopterin reductase-like flavin-dependent oxidoreductase (luciferase family)